jgi:hypothetical protein
VSGHFMYVLPIFKSPNQPSCSPLFPSPPITTALARRFPSCRHTTASPCHVASRSWRPSSFVRLDIVSTGRRLLPSFLHFTTDHLCSSTELAAVPASLPNCSRNHGRLNMVHLLSQFVPALATGVAWAPSSSLSTSRVPSRLPSPWPEYHRVAQAFLLVDYGSSCYGDAHELLLSISTLLELRFQRRAAVRTTAGPPRSWPRSARVCLHLYSLVGWCT